MRTMKIKFRNPNVDTEEVRECIEDNLGVEILEIEEQESQDAQELNDAFGVTE